MSGIYIKIYANRVINADTSVSKEVLNFPASDLLHCIHTIARDNWNTNLEMFNKFLNKSTSKFTRYGNSLKIVSNKLK